MGWQEEGSRRGFGLGCGIGLDGRVGWGSWAGLGHTEDILKS